MANREDDRIGIPFPNHSSDVLCSLNEQRQAGLLCDVVLVVRDHEYRTHRSILAAFSQYFKKLFAVGVDSHRHSVYEIDFVAPESLAAILEFAYTSTLTITNSNVKEILSAAQLLEIPCITSVCMEIMDATGPGGEEEEEDNLVGVEEKESREDEEEASDISTEVSEDRDPGAEEKSQKFPLSTVRKEVQREVLSVVQHDPEITEPLREKHRDSESLESRALKDFSIDALLQEGLHSSTERRSLFPGFFPLAWNHNFSGIMDPNPQYNQEFESRPMDLVLKKEAIKEEQREEVQPGFFHSDFLKELTGAGLCLGSDTHLGSIKNENLNSYLSFLSASHLGALFPPWSLEEDRKMKSKASQQCPVCNKVIQGAGKLPRHMRTHTGEKPYICTICEVRFTRQDKLKIHLRKHTGERPYVCLHCNSKFIHNYDLKNHLRIHTGVRPYRCEHCCKSFTRSDHLHRHVKRQSCRASRPRPRRGRKSTAWRSDNPPRLPVARDHCLSTGRTLLPAQPGLGDRWHHQGGESTGFIGLGTELLDRAQIGKAVSKRGMLAFSLDHENMLYSSTAAPWAMRLDHTHPVPGTTN